MAISLSLFNLNFSSYSFINNFCHSCAAFSFFFFIFYLSSNSLIKSSSSFLLFSSIFYYLCRFFYFSIFASSDGPNETCPKGTRNLNSGSLFTTRFDISTCDRDARFYKNLGSCIRLLSKSIGFLLKIDYD